MAQDLFGCVIPGRPLQSQWVQISPDKATMDLDAPGSIEEIALFLLPSTVLPAGFGAVLYFTVNGEAWEVLGSISIEKPSAIFRTGWTTREGMSSCPVVQLGIGALLPGASFMQGLPSILRNPAVLQGGIGLLAGDKPENVIRLMKAAESLRRKSVR